MTVTVENLQATADQLVDALEAYDRLVEEWPYDSATVPAGVREYLARLGQAGNPPPDPQSAKGTPLDLYVFRDHGRPGVTKDSR
jgi:hypothetical protein